MIKEESTYQGHADSPERVFHDHKALKDTIWKLYSEDLKVAQDQDILLPSSSSPGSPVSRSLRDLKDQREEAAQVSDKRADNNSPYKKSAVKTETNSTSNMERSDNTRSISPQLNSLLDLVIGMEFEQLEQVLSPSTDIKTERMTKESDRRSTVNNEKIFNSQRNEYNDKKYIPFDENQKMNRDQNFQTSAHSYMKTDEVEGNIRNIPKKRRLPAIEEVINKTSFANQLYDLYNPVKADSAGNDQFFGTEKSQQQFSGQQLPKPQNWETTTSRAPMPSCESHLYSSTEASRYPCALGSHNVSNERSVEEVSCPRTSPIANTSGSSWSFPNEGMNTLSNTSPQAQFQNKITPQREPTGIHELGIPHAEQFSPYFKNMPTKMDNNMYEKYKAPSSGVYGLPDPKGAVPPFIENAYCPNAMGTRSNPTYPYSNYMPSLVKEKEFQKHLHSPLHNPMFSSPVASSTMNHTSQHLENVNTQKLELESKVQSPTYSCNHVQSPYNNNNPQGVKIHPPSISPIHPIFAENKNISPVEFSQQNTNFADIKELQYSSAGSSVPAQQEYMKYSGGEAEYQIPNSLPVNSQSLYNAPKNARERFPSTRKAHWSKLFGNDSSLYKNMQRFPAPICHPRVQEFSSVHSQNLPLLDNQGLPTVARHQQCSPTFVPQHTPTTSARVFPYSNNRELRTQENPSTSTYDFPPMASQLTVSRPELHPPQLPQTIPMPIPSTSAVDHPMLNSIGTKQLCPHQGTNANTYSHFSNMKAPRRRRSTKKMSAAQTRRFQKVRKGIEETLLEFLTKNLCDEKTIDIVKKQLFHVQTCPNWLENDDCIVCGSICKLVAHSSECQNLYCPNLYCQVKAQTSVAEYFSDPNFLHGFLRQLNISDEEIKELLDPKNEDEIPTSQC